MRTLYILGNGFDLACGLKSRYADYFESRFKWYKGYNSSDSKAIPAIYEEIQDGGIKNIPSAWFIVFAYEHDQPGYRNDYVLWQDIEKISIRFYRIIHKKTRYLSANILNIFPIAKKIHLLKRRACMSF